jgi:hypothetical protein
MTPEEPLTQSARFESSDLFAGYALPSRKQSSGLLFITSVCGKYLLVAEGCTIYVYELRGDTLRPITSIFCPRRVLAMCMDTSSHEFAVAALLHGRMGLRRDLTSNGIEFKEKAVPIKNGSRYVYRYLCTEDDPPRSVAICPHRQCVAFGSATGVELHWIDALTGRDMSRWFPLTGPSDYLYFLPPRQEFDFSRKLRLISSTAHSGHQSTLCRQISIAEETLSTPLWGRMAFDTMSPSTTIRPGYIDHHRAVPLSDGFHILFSDPDSSMLCLGSDAPVGHSCRLLRKIMFIPPEEGLRPRLYTAGSDLDNGPRIISAFGDQLVLYSIASDIFNSSKKEQPTSDEWKHWWPEPVSESVWPLFVRGTVIGELDGLADVAVNEVGGLSIWAVSLDGQAVVWRVNT